MLEEEKKEELLALLTGKKYRELKSQLVEMNEVDIASFIEELDSEKTVVVFRMLPKELASEVFACLEVEQQQHIITSITDNELRVIIDDLYVDDAVDMLEELPAYKELVKCSVFDYVPEWKRREDENKKRTPQKAASVPHETSAGHSSQAAVHFVPHENTSEKKQVPDREKACSRKPHAVAMPRQKSGEQCIYDFRHEGGNFAGGHWTCGNDPLCRHWRR